MFENLRIEVWELVYQCSQSCIPMFANLYTKVCELVYQRFKTCIRKIMDFDTEDSQPWHTSFGQMPVVQLYLRLQAAAPCCVALFSNTSNLNWTLFKGCYSPVIQAGLGHKKKPRLRRTGAWIGWRRPTLPHCCAVPSALAGLTSLFGMGRGGAPPLKPPKSFV